MNSVICPVPDEQRPINEYQDLKESWFFRWATLDRIDYLKPIVFLWLLSWMISAPVAAVSFPPAKHLPQFFLFASAGALIIPALALLRLYLGWAYVQRRLIDPAVFYEESGWYDGQMWQKPPEILAQDRLVVSYQVQPILERLKKTFGAIALTSTIGVVIWFFI
jgi:hypothetical protein